MSSTALHADLPARLKAAADKARDADSVAKLTVKRRNQLIIAAHDEAGMSQGAIATATGLTQPTINRVLAKSADLDDVAELGEAAA